MRDETVRAGQRRSRIIRGMEQFIVAADRACRSPICNATTRSVVAGTVFGPQPYRGTRGIDQFIGEPDMLGSRPRLGFHRALSPTRLLASGRAARRHRSRSRQCARNPRL